MLPDFLLIGAQKCGTTSLYEYLVSHPCVYRASIKEVGYYDRYYQKGFKWYRNQFPTSLRKYHDRVLKGQKAITGEASTGYILYPHALRRIAATLPAAKLILVLRNPVDRAYSHYQHSLRIGRENLSFEDAVEKEEERIGAVYRRVLEDENYYGEDLDYYAYLTTGMYASQVLVLKSLFPDERILILKSEDLLASPQTAVNHVLSFLGLPPMELTQPKKFNSGKYRGINPSTRAELIDRFKPHNQALYDVLGRDFGWQ